MTKSQKIHLAVYLIAFVCAVSVPLWKVASMEIGRRSAPLFLFKVEGYDPYDPLRGRYLRLNTYQSIRMKPSEGGNDARVYWNSTPYEMIVYAVLKKDSDDKAEITRLVKTREEASGEPVLKVRFKGCHEDWNMTNKPLLDALDESAQTEASAEQVRDILLDYKLPFERYFVSESIADEADKILTNARNDGKAYLAVRILPDGAFAIDDLLIDGVPIEKAAARK